MALKHRNQQYYIKQLNSKNEKYFNFLKMDKKNVQNRLAKNALTEKKNRLDN